MTRARTYAALCALAAAAVYAVMWVGYCRGWHWEQRMDWALLDAARDIAAKHPLWVRFWAAVSNVLGPVPLRALGTVATVVALVRRRVRAALLLLACVTLSGLVTVVAKMAVNRPRPSTMLVAAESTSFPSGHALEATAAWLAMLFLVWPAMARWLRRLAITVTALSLLAVGASRVALNVHYPSDVLAGWSLGYLYFLLCLITFRPTPSGDAVKRCGDQPLVTAQ